MPEIAAITQAGIATAVSARTGITVAASALTSEIKATLHMLGREALWPCLYDTDTTLTIGISAVSVALPETVRVLDSVVLTYDGSIRAPLELITQEQYNEYMVGYTTASRSRPLCYMRRGNLLYLYPVPLLAATTTTVKFWQNHPYTDESTTILFPGQFAEALNWGTTYRYLENTIKLQEHPRYEFAKQSYREEVASLLAEADYRVTNQQQATK